MILARKKPLTWSLVLAGLGLIFYFGGRTLGSYRQLQYIHEQGFDTGDADVDAIRPWMTIHFVAAAYAVPKEYIYAELGISSAERRHDIDVEHLNDELRLGRSADGDGPAVIDRLRQIILAYKENPVATGLADVRGWMTLNYIANSSGIPTATMIDELGLEELALQKPPASASGGDAGVSVHKPLVELARDLHYPRGTHGLGEDIEAVVTRHAQDVQ